MGVEASAGVAKGLFEKRKVTPGLIFRLFVAPLFTTSCPAPI